MEKECDGDLELLRELRNLLGVDVRLAGMTARPLEAAGRQASILVLADHHPAAPQFALLRALLQR